MTRRSWLLACLRNREAIRQAREAPRHPEDLQEAIQAQHEASSEGSE